MLRLTDKAPALRINYEHFTILLNFMYLIHKIAILQNFPIAESPPNGCPNNILLLLFFTSYTISTMGSYYSYIYIII